MKINSNINLAKHDSDLKLCKDYIQGNRKDEFHSMYIDALQKVERYLKTNQQRLNIGDDWVDILGVVSENVLRKISNFRGGSLFSTWVFGFVRNHLLQYWTQQKKLSNHEITDCIATSEHTTLEEFASFKLYLDILNQTERTIMIYIFLHGLTFHEISKKYKVSEESIQLTYNKSLEKIKSTL